MAKELFPKDQVELFHKEEILKHAQLQVRECQEPQSFHKELKIKMANHSPDKT